jgi:hypothetical protein
MSFMPSFMAFQYTVLYLCEAEDVRFLYLPWRSPEGFHAKNPTEIEIRL